MNHEKLLKLLFAVSHATEQNAPILFDVSDMLRPVPVLTKNNLNSEAFDLFSASAFLYQSLFTTTAFLDAVSVHLETYCPHVSKELIAAIDNNSKACLTAMRIATEGIDKVLLENGADISI